MKIKLLVSHKVTERLLGNIRENREQSSENRMRKPWWWWWWWWWCFRATTSAFCALVAFISFSTHSNVDLGARLKREMKSDTFNPCAVRIEPLSSLLGCATVNPTATVDINIQIRSLISLLIRCRTLRSLTDRQAVGRPGGRVQTNPPQNHQWSLSQKQESSFRQLVLPIQPPCK